MIDLINKLFDINFKIKEIEAPKKLPVFMKVNRRFYHLIDGDVETILIEILKSEKFGVIAYKKQLEEYIDTFNLPSAYWFSTISKYQRESFINKKIPFICNEQIYMPYLGMMLNSKFKNKKNISVKKMMPVTQSLFIYLTVILKGKKVLKKDAASFLKVSCTSLTRASEQLLAMGLIKQEIKGVQYYIWADKFDINLLNKAKQYLINPIKETIVVENNKDYKKLPYAGESALSMNSMLSEPDMIVLASYKNNKIDANIINERWNIDKDIIKIELWKYDPLLFTDNNCVDPISLYMSLNNNGDERVQGELEQYMENYK